MPLAILAFGLLLLAPTSVYSKDLATVKTILQRTLNAAPLDGMGYFLNSNIIKAVKTQDEMRGVSHKRMFGWVDKAMAELGFGKWYVDSFQIPSIMQRKYGLAPYNGGVSRKQREEGYRRSIFVRDNDLNNVPEDIRPYTNSAYITGGTPDGYDPEMVKVLGLHEPSFRMNRLEADIEHEFVDLLKNMRLTTPTGEPVLSLLMEVRAESVQDAALCPKGFSDFMLLYPNSRYKCLFLETKTPSTGLSERQEEFRNRMHLLGYKYYVFRSAKEGVEAIQRYLRNEMGLREGLK